MAYIPSLIGAATLFACYMLSVMTLTGLQLTAGIAGALVVYASTVVLYFKAWIYEHDECRLLMLWTAPPPGTCVPWMWGC